MASQTSGFFLAEDSDNENHNTLFLVSTEGRVKVRADKLREKSAFLAAKFNSEMSDTIVLEGLERSIVKCLVTWMEQGNFQLPKYTPATLPLDNPSAHVQQVTAKHSMSVVGSPGGGPVSLRYNKGQVNLSGLVAHQKPNLQGCIDVYKAAIQYKINGLAQAAATAFRQRSMELGDHAESQRLRGSGLPSAILRF